MRIVETVYKGGAERFFYVRNNPIKNKYKVSGESIPTEGLKRYGSNGIGQCAEPKVSYAASQNSSDIEGMDTVWRGNKENEHAGGIENSTDKSTKDLIKEYNDDLKKKLNSGKISEDEYNKRELLYEYEQMKLCDTCANPNNLKEYMNYAYSNKGK